MQNFSCVKYAQILEFKTFGFSESLCMYTRKQAELKTLFSSQFQSAVENSITEIFFLNSLLEMI